MSNILNKLTVLVLNRNWQAIHTRTPAEAFCMMATNVATALDIHESGDMMPVKWSEWLSLPVRDGDNSVQTVHGGARAPTVIVLANFARVPKCRPSFSAKHIWDRDGGTCQYTGRKLLPHEGNIDHVLPRSRGGKTSWDNCVLADRKVNSRKANKLPEEVGLHLRREPMAPRELPSTLLIRNSYHVRDWDRFLNHAS